MPKKILIVDDEPLIVKGLKYSLEQDGYETDSAQDGEEAVNKFFAGQYDLCLLYTSGDLVDGHIGGGGDLAHHQHHAGGGAALAGDVGVGVLGEDGVEHGVGDLVADLVGMALGDGFGSKQSPHQNILRDLLEQKNPPSGELTEKYRYLASSSGAGAACRRGNWHLAAPAREPVAGFHRARPSTTLDKACFIVRDVLYTPCTLPVKMGLR